MSTRGAVGWGNLDGWTGVYNHYDSYPGGLGTEVWEEIRRWGAEEVVRRLQRAGMWQDVPSDVKADEGDIRLMNERSADKLFIEWVYIIDLVEGQMHVLSHCSPEHVRPGLRQVGPPHKSGYCHWHVGSVSFSARKFPSLKDAGASEEDEEEAAEVEVDETEDRNGLILDTLEHFLTRRLEVERESRTGKEMAANASSLQRSLAYNSVLVVLTELRLSGADLDLVEVVHEVAERLNLKE